MITVIIDIMIEIWDILNEASIFIMFGFFIAGITNVFISGDKIAKYLGGNTFSSIIKASILGIPIPLCSCGVVPTAVALKKNGASNGAVLSFLISTPESGVDSIAITYAMLDPIITVFRPFCAFITALTAGTIEMLTSRTSKNGEQANTDSSKSCNIKGCDIKTDEHDDIKHTLKEKLSSGIHYGFFDLLGEVSRWLLIGIIIAGLISYFIPDSFFKNYIGSGISSMFIMLFAGVPLYICASASTPIAAALVLKGLNPGAALVFLLAGPATNIATLAVVNKFLGKRITIIYLISISACSILLGLLLNQIYFWLNTLPKANIGTSVHIFPEWLEIIFSLALLTLMTIGIYKEYEHKKKDGCDCDGH